MQLVVGLGNPGPRYAGTRHNAGFLVVERLAQRRGMRFAPQRQALVARGAAGLVLAQPTTFMNLSGAAVQALMTRHGVRPSALLVVHDDLDLPLGRLRFKHGGGAGGQRGVQDTIARIGPAFDRLKVGISRPPPRWEVERWVLSRFADEERDLLERVIEAGADSVERWLDGGLEPAQNWANGLDLRPLEGPPDGAKETAPGAVSPADERAAAAPDDRDPPS